MVALRHVAFTIQPGELLGLIGPNGAGKTALFECLAGVQPMDAGELVLAAGDSQSLRRSAVLFYIPYGIAPWPDQSVSWALEFGLGFFNGRRRRPPAGPGPDSPPAL
jgi:ABC-type multidrug transport system ATPase subunit